MSTKKDVDITPKLSVRSCVLGGGVESDDDVVRLYGVSGAELDYAEDLTLEQAKALVRELQSAIKRFERNERWRKT